MSRTVEIIRSLQRRHMARGRPPIHSKDAEWLYDQIIKLEDPEWMRTGPPPPAATPACPSCRSTDVAIEIDVTGDGRATRGFDMCKSCHFKWRVK